MDKQTAFEDAIARAGGVSALARKLNELAPDDPPLLPQHVTNWRRRGLPPARCLAVEGVTGVSRHLLLPEVFGAAPQATAPQNDAQEVA